MLTNVPNVRDVSAIANRRVTTVRNRSTSTGAAIFDKAGDHIIAKYYVMFPAGG